MTSTRQQAVAAILEQHTNLQDQIGALSRTEIVTAIPEDEWATAHAGTCVMCKADTARMYPTGWFCDNHRPR
jgi:hypothetical protein